MSKRLTLIAIFNQNSLTNITQKLKDKPCIVPFGRVDNREKSNTLPFHITILSWDNSKKEEILTNLSKLSFPKLKILINDIKIMNGKENSYVLYFNIADNNSLIKLKQHIYNIISKDKSISNKINFHITIHIDKDYSKIINMQKILLQNFTPFELEIENYKLYEIYPPLLIKTIK